MKTRLTLQIDDKLIAQAKNYAKQNGKSLSQIVSDYFQFLTTQKEEPDKTPPKKDDFKI